MTLHREGTRYILLASVLWAVIGWLSWRYLAGPLPLLFWGIMLICFLLWFWIICFSACRRVPTPKGTSTL